MRSTRTPLVGTSVGLTAAASDADATTNTITYSLTNNDGGRFAIDANTGVVTVAGAIDREADGASRNITVRATSSRRLLHRPGLYHHHQRRGRIRRGRGHRQRRRGQCGGRERRWSAPAVGITAAASDADATTNTITYSLTNNDGGRFAIDANTGVVTVAGAIDREADGASRNITVRATSADGSFTDQVFTININDVDEFDVGAVTDSDAAANAVNENAVVGTSVGITAAASDADATTNTITYSLTNNDGGRFAIDANTGVVTVAGAIDREADGASRNITVRATSADGSFTDQVFTDQHQRCGRIRHRRGHRQQRRGQCGQRERGWSAPASDITAAASDADATTNTITYTLDDDAGGLFAIDANTGVVTVAGAIDYETASNHSITVRATSQDGSFAIQSFTINVRDVNESGIGPISDNDPTPDCVLENSVAGTVVGVTALANDPDGTDTINYSLDDNAGGRFAIAADSGVVTVASAIDREQAASYDIVVRATSSDGSFTTRNFTIAIGDEDDFDVGPLSDTNPVPDKVPENALPGTVVGITALATDGDVTNNTVTYTLDDSAGGRFAINAHTGVITVAGAIDYDTATSHTITIRAARRRRFLLARDVHYPGCRPARLGSTSDRSRRHADAARAGPSTDRRQVRSAVHRSRNRANGPAGDRTFLGLRLECERARCAAIDEYGAIGR